MRISKRSWHYRLLKASSNKLVNNELPPMNFCKYFRELFLLICFGLPLIGVMILLMSPIFCAAYILDFFDKRKSDKKLNKMANSTGEPRTLLGKWLKAKKEKVCPILEWE